MKIVIFCPNWVGDAVMATPALRAVRRAYPEARIAGLMRPAVAKTLDPNPWLDDIILIQPNSTDRSQGVWSVIRTLRRESYDVGLLLTNSLRSAWLAWLGRVKRRIGYSREGRRILLTDAVRPNWNRKDGYVPGPMVQYYLKLAARFGAEVDDARLELFTSAKDESLADALLAKWGVKPGDSLIAFNPGSAFGSAKRWPATNFAELARRLVERPATRAVVLCGPEERGLARFISDASLRPRLVHHLGDEQVSIGLSKAIVRRSRLMVSTDSGPRHFAAAFNVPVVSLFGPTHIEWTDTRFAGEIKLQKKLPCGPCQQRVCPLGHLQCMKDLDVDLVHGAALRLLENYPLRLAG